MSSQQSRMLGLPPRPAALPVHMWPPEQYTWRLTVLRAACSCTCARSIHTTRAASSSAPATCRSHSTSPAKCVL
eukprot:jgi/Mesen1/8570/ME000497S07980